MSRAARYRLLLIAAAVVLLEILCRTGVIDRLTMQPPERSAVRSIGRRLSIRAFSAMI
jgi:NitT/TauT family transport system permease protein